MYAQYVGSHSHGLLIIKQANQTSKSNKRDLLHKTDNHNLKSHTMVFITLFYNNPNPLSELLFNPTYIFRGTQHMQAERKKN